MIVGDIGVFAIESAITEAFRSDSQLALGCFVIHVDGRSYGVKEPNASIMGCSFDEVGRRIQQRGSHSMSVFANVSAQQIVESYLDALFGNSPRAEYFGSSREGFVEALYSNAVTWAPDGDEAFDDGSFVLQFDVESRVRLIAFVNTDSPEDVPPALSEVRRQADQFYGLLSLWRNQFAVELESRLKQLS